MLKSINLGCDRGVYIANIVKCHPPKNHNPQPQEAKTCMTYLKRQIQLIKPKLIVALGRVAAVNLLQTDEAVVSLRQQPHDYEGIRTVVTYHPAYLLCKPTDKKKSWDDLRHIRRLIEEN